MNRNMLTVLATAGVAAGVTGECFESTHAGSREIRLANAEIAWDVAEPAVTDAAVIQRAIHERG